MNKIRKSHEFPSVQRLTAELFDFLKHGHVIDAIVVSGNGEPTLHPAFHEAMKIIVEIRREHLPDKKILVLSNGAHLDSKKVLAGMHLADERIIKIDAGNDSQLDAINRPLIRLNITRFLSDVGKLNDCIVQSLFVDGEVSNVSKEAIEDWIEVVGMAKPKSVQICTMSRPGFTDKIKAVSEDILDEIAHKLKKRTSLECEVFAIKNPQ